MASQGTLLITGGAGYIGSHTVKHLLAQGERLVVLDNLVFGHREALPLDQVTFIHGDMSDAELVDQIFCDHQPEAVLHFAAYAYVGESVTDPLKYYRNNLAAPLVLLEAMQRHGCRRFIFSSTCATYGNPVHVPMDESHPQAPVNPYGASKWMLERVLRDCDHAWGLKSVFLRYFNASGCDPEGQIGEDHDPETHLIPRILMAAAGEIADITVFGTDYPTPDGTCIRDYIHVNDLASAHALALGYLRGGGSTEAVNLGTGRGFSVNEIIQTAQAVTGKSIPVSYGPRRAGDPPELICQPAKAKALLGWEAQHQDPREHIQSAWNWMTGPKKGHYAE
ncbi:UDP-glucose 4-epimerase GalE [Prosthecobacter dejongeii]|uniref:UDP-glucose 4-epimerase n=1 Tax=Prosthecobacter dejongeii TaxID=48465 RepID=A0A7W7YJT0_9BACT|nr:UDP-glucose 4-epimerase GalE [Prosthecobacter dejongeii]MBB5037481.1 UDP-glucose-4-epimerase GalE [Prosthecobacter dejongeii]